MKEKLFRFRDKIGVYLYPFVFFIALFMFDFSFRGVFSFAASTDLYHWAPTVFTLSWSAIFTVIVFVIPFVAKRIVMSVILGAFTLLEFVHAVVYNVSGSFLSFSDLAFAEDGAAFISIQYLAFSWRVYVALFLSLAMGVFAVLLAPKKTKYHWIPLTLCAAVLGGSITGIALTHKAYYHDGSGNNFVWTDTYAPGSIRASYTEFTNPNECLLLCGNYQYLFRSVTQSLNDVFSLGQMHEDLDAYYAAKSDVPEENEMTGVLRGQNAIAILLESIDTWMITEEFMPNLWALQQECVNFENHYTPLFLSAGTFNTECAFNIGFYLPVTGTSARTYATNIYPQSLPNLFRNAGYAANSYHTLDGRFYNREVVHPLWGYEKYNDHDDMELQGLQVRDTTLMEAYDMMVGHDKPFFNYVITYSGHGPYTETRDDIALPHLEEAKLLAKNSGITTDNMDTWSQFVRAIAHARETDAFIGQLLDAMESDGKINNTTLILFGDHYCKYLTDTSFVMGLKEVDNTNSLCRTPFMIYSKVFDEPMSVEKVTSAVDMLPTIANLFDLNYNPRYLVGNDAFSDGGGFVCFKDYSWIDSNTHWTPQYEGEETDAIQARCQEVREILNVSWNTVKSGYFNYLEKKN